MENSNDQFKTSHAATFQSCCICCAWYDQTILKMQIHLKSLFEINWIMDLSNTTCFSSRLKVVPRRLIIKIKLQTKLRAKCFRLDRMTNYSICNLFFYLMAFVGFFVVKGEGWIGVIESGYMKKDNYSERIVSVIFMWHSLICFFYTQLHYLRWYTWSQVCLETNLNVHVYKKIQFPQTSS